MKSLRIENLKSIVDSGNIEIKPMTVIIGKNSSGKSTFLRVFPLLKQSLNKKLSSPILWYGDYVDFGSFNKALNRQANLSESKMRFSFYFDNLEAINDDDSFSYISISLMIVINDKNIDEYQVNIDKYGTLRFVRNNDDFVVFANEKKIDDLVFKSSFEQSFFPTTNQGHISRYALNSYFLTRFALNKGGEWLFRNTILSDKTLTSLFDDEHLTSLAKDYSKSISLHSKEKLDIKETKKILITNIILELFDNIEDSFKKTFENVQYFEPLRSRGDRFYRVQGLNTKEIDSNGNNAPMILYQMKSNEKEKFQQWCSENLGFYYDTVAFGDGEESASVVVCSKTNKDDFNMTDVGFGYSQIFPILLSVWKTILAGQNNSSEIIIVIEQPELHLHPAFQKKIIRTFLKLIDISKKNKINLKFIIETHSEVFINYFGKLIFNKELNSEDINLLVCEKENGESSFSKMLFNNEGVIENWPVGFFSDEN